MSASCPAGPVGSSVQAAGLCIFSEIPEILTVVLKCPEI